MTRAIGRGLVAVGRADAGRLDLRGGREYYGCMLSTPPLCPSCGQPSSQALAGPEHGWECRNEACAEFGQALAEHEPAREDPGPARASRG